MSDIEALKDAVEALRVAEAVEILGALPERVLIDYGLDRLWRIFRDAKFIQGELHIAPVIEREYAQTPHRYARAVDSYLMAGMLPEGGRALEHLLTLPNTENLLRNLVILAPRSERRDLCEAVLQLLLNDTLLTAHEKVLLGTRMAKSCFGWGGREVSVRCVRQLKEKFGEQDEDIDLIATCMQEIGEFSMALELRMRLSSADPDNISKKLDIVLLESMMGRDRPRILEALAKILAQPEETVEFRRRVARTYEFINEVEDAIAALQHVLRLGGNPVETRRRVIRMAISRKNYLRVEEEISKILELQDLSFEVLWGLAGAATKIGAKTLSLKCSERQFGGDRFTPEALRKTVPGAGEWYVLATEAARLGRDDLERQMLEFGLSYYPADKTLLAQKKTLEARVKLLGTGKKSGDGDGKHRVWNKVKALFSEAP